MGMVIPCSAGMLFGMQRLYIMMLSAHDDLTKMLGAFADDSGHLDARPSQHQFLAPGHR